MPGDTVRAEVTHKLTIRPRSCRLTTATYFVYEGQRYDVLYWQPHYKRRDRLEVMLKLVVEDALTDLTASELDGSCGTSGGTAEKKC